MPSYLTSEIFEELFRNAPDRFVGDEYFQKVEDTVYAWADEFENWIDPNSEYYAEELWDAEREGADNFRAKVVDILEEAVYREAMFGDAVNVLDLLKTVRELKVEGE